MRIIAGDFRGRKLLSPESDATRPITDRAKQSLFDVLSPLLPDAIIYDCFAGTGSMGLESLSRGASAATFFERDRTAVKRLEQNIESLGVRDRSRLVAGDIFSWFKTEKMRPADAAHGAGVVFLDPPYRFVRERTEDLKNLARMLASHHLAADGIVVFRHDASDNLELAGLARYDQRQYGQMMIEFLRRRE